MHVDTDEANAFNSDTEPYGVIVKFFDSNFNTDKWIEDELSGIRDKIKLPVQTRNAMFPTEQEFIYWFHGIIIL